MSNCDAYKKKFSTKGEATKFYQDTCLNPVMKHFYPRTCNLIDDCIDANTGNTGNTGNVANVAKDDGVKPKYVPFYFNKYLVHNMTLRTESNNTGSSFDDTMKLVCTNKEYRTDINTVYDKLAKIEIDKKEGKPLDPDDVMIITETMKKFEPDKLFNSIKAKLDQVYEEINNKSEKFVSNINTKLQALTPGEENQIGGKRRYRHKTFVNNNRRLCTLCKKTLRRL